MVHIADIKISSKPILILINKKRLFEKECYNELIHELLALKYCYFTSPVNDVFHCFNEK